VSEVLRPAVGTAVFALFALAGPIVGVPWVVSGRRLQAPLLDGEPSRWLGVLLFLLGLPLWVDAVVRFVRQGHGTPAPVAPPLRLVVTGPYRYVRNPMYLGVLAMIFGQALLLGSSGILLYGLCAALASHLFVILYEEPTLRARFGAEYSAYCRQVHRWVPRGNP
jgi:protein-S-isoprenylcysteine O-methyltransferase Ste14